jgi:hypothetical protein
MIAAEPFVYKPGEGARGCLLPGIGGERLGLDEVLEGTGDQHRQRGSPAGANAVGELDQSLGGFDMPPRGIRLGTIHACEQQFGRGGVVLLRGSAGIFDGEPLGGQLCGSVGGSGGKRYRRGNKKNRNEKWRFHGGRAGLQELGRWTFCCWLLELSLVELLEVVPSAWSVTSGMLLLLLSASVSVTVSAALLLVALP